jgi:hypothetical protein
MRKVFLLVSMVAVVVAAPAATASARTETRFSVFDIFKSEHPAGNSFIVHGVLVRPSDHHVVGHDRAKVTPRAHGQLRVRGVESFRGAGTIKVKGTLGPGRGGNRLSIIGGAGEFNGAAGKLKTRSISHKKLLATFIFVQ